MEPLKRLSKIEILEKVGKVIIEREHQYGMEEMVDDEEYIPLIRRIIESLSSILLEESIAENDVVSFGQRLHDFAQRLYVDLWMTQAEEEGEATLKEMKKAKRAFDEIYLNEGVKIPAPASFSP